MAKPRSKKETGEEYLNRILQHVPEDKRAGVLEALGQDAVKELLGEGVLMKDDYSRLANESNTAKTKFETLYQQNNDWLAAKGEELAALKVENATLKATRGTRTDDGDPEPAPKPAAAPAIPEDVVRRGEVDQLRTQAAGFIQGMLNLGMQHLYEWKEPLDLNALDEHCRQVGKHALQGGYDSFMAERRAARATQAEKDKEAAIRKDEREKLMREQSAPPAPSADGALLTFGEGTLVGLNKDRVKDFGVDAAVRNTMVRRQTKGA